jgi:hypothetical protein
LLILHLPHAFLSLLPAISISTRKFPQDAEFPCNDMVKTEVVNKASGSSTAILFYGKKLVNKICGHIKFLQKVFIMFGSLSMTHVGHQRLQIIFLNSQIPSSTSAFSAGTSSTFHLYLLLLWAGYQKSSCIQHMKKGYVSHSHPPGEVRSYY